MIRVRGPAGPRFGLLLVGILAVYAAVVGSGQNRLAGLMETALLSLVLIAAARYEGASGGRTLAAVTCGLAALVVSLLAYRAGSIRLSVAWNSLAVMFLVLVSITAVIRVLWRRPVADAQTLGGALAVYLLLALLFATVHQFLASTLAAPYVKGIAGFANGAEYLYFSVITLATVGYGDMTPACDAARAVAMAEALVGQLYLVAVVGTVVGSWVGLRKSPRSTKP